MIASSGGHSTTRSNGNSNTPLRRKATAAFQRRAGGGGAGAGGGNGDNSTAFSEEDDDWSVLERSAAAEEDPTVAEWEKNLLRSRPAAAPTSPLTIGVSLFNLFYVGFETLFSRAYQRQPKSLEEYYRSDWLWLSGVYLVLAMYFLFEMIRFWRQGGVRAYFSAIGHRVQFGFLLAHLCNVCGSLLVVPLVAGNAGHLRKSLTVCFLLRVLTAFRLLQTIRSLETTMAALTIALSSLLWTGMFLFVIMYLFANLATRLLARDPDQEQLQRIWGTFGQAMYSLFMITTLDGIYTFASDTYRLHAPHVRPWVALYFVVYVMFTSILWLNVVTGVIVDSYLHADRKLRRRAQNEEMLKAQSQTVALMTGVFAEEGAAPAKKTCAKQQPAQTAAAAGPAAESLSPENKLLPDSKLLVLRGSSPWELLMDASWRRAIKRGGVPEHQAYDVLTILKEAGVELISVRDFAEACAVVSSGNATGRQLLVTQLQQRTHHQSVASNAEQVWGTLQRTQANVKGLLDETWLARDRPPLRKAQTLGKKRSDRNLLEEAERRASLAHANSLDV